MKDKTDKAIKVFSASWCNPCKQLKATLQQLNLSSNLEFILIDEQPELAKQLGIRSVPTTIIYEGGNEVQRISGNNPNEIMKADQYVISMNEGSGYA